MSETVMTMMERGIVGSELESTTTEMVEFFANQTRPPLEDLPLYLRITVGALIVIILAVGTIGNVMVTMVISCSRDMRTSTNFFLVNLSVADLLVLLLVTPTALLEVVYHPDVWVLGSIMCKVVPMLELLVCHASVLTILAISFERYYAICSPLKVLYVCTKARAVYICILVWIFAIFITSPMIFMTYYIEPTSEIAEPRCIIEAGRLYPDLYTILTIIIFFLLPFLILLITYKKIASKLNMDRSDLNAANAKNENHRARARSQVILMLGTVVFTFFFCLLPFRILTLMVLVTDYDSVLESHTETFYTILYFSRVMTYINSALNPILYNIMSSKFRNGFKRLCGRRKGKGMIFKRNGTFLTLTTASIRNKNSAETSPELSASSFRKNGVLTTAMTPMTSSRKLEHGSFYTKYAQNCRGTHNANTMVSRV